MRLNAEFYVFLAVATAWTFIGWAILYLSSWTERRRQARHPALVSEPQAVESPTLTQPPARIRFLDQWLLP